MSRSRLLARSPGLSQPRGRSAGRMATPTVAVTRRGTNPCDQLGVPKVPTTSGRCHPARWPGGANAASPRSARPPSFRSRSAFDVRVPGPGRFSVALSRADRTLDLTRTISLERSELERSELERASAQILPVIYWEIPSNFSSIFCLWSFAGPRSGGPSPGGAWPNIDPFRPIASEIYTLRQQRFSLRNQELEVPPRGDPTDWAEAARRSVWPQRNAAPPLRHSDLRRTSASRAGSTP